MYGTSFDNLNLHLYVIGRRSQTHMLKYWPAETATTLLNASTSYRQQHG